jgi:hypothetical protein
MESLLPPVLDGVSIQVRQIEPSSETMDVILFNGT